MTPTDDQLNALHWAAVSMHRKGQVEAGDGPLTATQLAAHERYQARAASHGWTTGQIDEYRRTRLASRPAL